MMMKNFVICIIVTTLFSCHANKLQRSKFIDHDLEKKTVTLLLDTSEEKVAEGDRFVLILKKITRQAGYVVDTTDFVFDKNSKAILPEIWGDFNIASVVIQHKDSLRQWQSEAQFIVTNQKRISLSLVIKDREIKIENVDVVDNDNYAFMSFEKGMGEIMRGARRIYKTRGRGEEICQAVYRIYQSFY